MGHEVAEGLLEPLANVVINYVSEGTAYDYCSHYPDILTIFQGICKNAARDGVRSYPTVTLTEDHWLCFAKP